MLFVVSSGEMSDVGATVNAGGTHQRRRVAEYTSDQEKDKSADPVQIALEYSKSDLDSEALFNCNGGHHHPAVRYLLMRKRMPENWVLCMEECVLSLWRVLNSLTWRKRMRLMILLLLLMMVVVSSFCLLAGGGTAAHAAGDFVRLNFMNDFSSNVKGDFFDSKSSGSSNVGLKRKMKEFPVR